jgi:hypothetical protein
LREELSEQSLDINILARSLSYVEHSNLTYKVDTVEVVRHQEHLLQKPELARAHGGFLFFSELLLDLLDFPDDTWVILRQLADAGKIIVCIVDIPVLDQEAGGLSVEEGEDKDKAGEHEVH